jgi:hypothetical protein
MKQPLLSQSLFVHIFYLRLAGVIIQARGVEVKRLIIVVILAILLMELVKLGISDTDIYVADASISDNMVTSSISKASNS